MEYKYIDGTGLVKTALTVFALSLMPSSNHFIPRQVSANYGDYAETNTQSVSNSSFQIMETKQVEILVSFANRLVENTKDLDVDIAQIISDDFWEMYD